MTKKKETYDFDAWNEDTENALIESIREENTITRYLITREGVLVAELPSGDILKAPLRTNVKQLEELAELADRDNMTDLDTLRAFFQKIGDEHAEQLLMSQDFGIAESFTRLYFEKFKKLNAASVGE